jgi:hypothetical protein
MAQGRDAGSYRLEWIDAVRYQCNACGEKLDWGLLREKKPYIAVDARAIRALSGWPKGHGFALGAVRVVISNV